MKRTLVTLTALTLLFGSTGATLVSANELDLEHSGDVNTTEVKTSAEGRGGIFRQIEQKFRADIRDKETALKVEAEARKEAMAKAKVDFKAEVKVKKEEIKDEKKVEKRELRDEKSDRKVTGLVNAFNHVISQLQNIVTRINSRIAKIKAAGGDTTVAEAKVALATTDLAKAKLQVTALQNVDLTVASGTQATSTLKVKLTAAKAAADLVKSTLRSVHQSLEAAVRSLNANVHIETHATSTAATSTEA